MKKPVKKSPFRFSYPLKQFFSHFCAMTIVRNYEEVKLDYDSDRDPWYVGNEHGFESNTLRIMDYMAQHIKDKNEQIYKGSILAIAMYYLARYRRRFYNAGLMIPGRGKGHSKPDQVAEPLLQAFHHFYVVKSLENVDPRRLIRLARKYEQEQE